MSEFDNPHAGGFFVSTESRLLDHTWIANTILGTYWGGWRTHDLIAESIRNSLCFGLYERKFAEMEGPPIGSVDHQVGFGRVVTDYATFSEICDVVVDEKYRGRGLGKFLVNTMIHDPRIAKTVMHLATRDRQALYAQFDFKPVERMRRIPS